MSNISIGRFRGGFCVYWRDEVGRRRRHSLEARTRTEAEAEAIEVYRRESARSEPRGATVSEIWEAYVKDLGDRPAGVTMGYTGKAVLQHFGAHTPANIDKDLCLAYRATRLEQGKSDGTVHTELGHLRMALSWAVKTKVIEEAPTIWRPAKPETDKRILNKGEMRALVEATRAPHTRLAVILLLGTAARVGAILDLTWDRIDFEAGSINLRLPDSRTRKGRAIVPMSGMTRAALSSAKEAALTDYVIEHGAKPVKKVRKGILAAVERAKLGHVRIHDLRHTAAVTMLSEGVPLEMVSQCLGHSNTAITFKTYARYLPQHMQQAVDVLDFMDIRTAS